MNGPRVLYHMVRADFLERVRRYSFLLTLGFAVYLGYAVYSGQVTLRLDKYSGVINSAWLGAVIGLVGTVWGTLVGFYVVKNSIQRDRQTRVGQILATTPMSKSFYTLSKMLSNLAVLGAMILILALAAVAIQLFQGEDKHIELFTLLSPILILGLSAMAVCAALAVLFESLPVLRGGVGNILYFFVWIFMLTMSVTAMQGRDPAAGSRALRDYTGIATVMGQMHSAVQQIDPKYNGASSFGIGPVDPSARKFIWNGVHWNTSILVGRLMWIGVAIAIALLAALFFDRFDPARGSWLPGNRQKFARKPGDGVLALSQYSAPDGFERSGPGRRERYAPMHLTSFARTGRQAGSHTRFFALVVAELRLLLRGHGWWWYAGAAGLFVACLASPLDTARSGLIVVAWIWPVLAWSQMGTREAQYATGALIFSAPRAVPRQLLASYAAGVLMAALTGGGLALHLAFARDFAGVTAWAAGALFIPAMALALGVTTGTRKAFEAIYTCWWYIGPLHHIPQADFMGTTAQSSTPVGYLVAAMMLVMLAYSWRKVRLAYA
jgi:hypothetical protein